MRIVGGTGAIDEDVAAAVDEHAGTVSRIAGSTRYDTSVAAADVALAEGADASTVWLATGRNWPDGLVAGAADGLVLLIDGTDVEGSPATTEWLQQHAAGLDAVGLAGGAAAITPAVEEAVRAAASPTP